MDTSESKVTALENEIRVGLNMIEQEEFSTTIRAVAKVAADVVRKTLGPYAKTTILDDGAFVYPTKDGWTVMSRIRFADPLHQSMFKMIQKIPAAIVDKVGDGTTTAMVAAQHFIEVFTEEEDKFTGVRQADIMDSLHKVKDAIIDDLTTNCYKIGPEDDYASIYNVAMVSSNGNRRLAAIMQRIYKETNNPNVLVDRTGGADLLSYEIQRGYRLDCSVLMQERYINTSEKYYNTNGIPHLFVVFDHNVDYNTHAKMIEDLISTRNAYSQNKQVPSSLVIMAPHFDDIIAATIASSVNDMLKQNPRSIPNIMLVQIPELSRHQQQCYLRDFASIGNIPVTNATMVKVYNTMKYNLTKPADEQIHDPAMKTEEYSFTSIQALLNSCYGVVHNATFGKKFVVLQDIERESVLYKESMKIAQDEYETAKKQYGDFPTSFVNELMDARDRLMRLSGNIGVIHVGGASELERSCTMDTVDDVFHACKSAYESGIVPGLNMGVLVAIERLVLDPSYTRGDVFNQLDKNLISILKKAYLRTTLDVLRNKRSAGSLWSVEGLDLVDSSVDDKTLIDGIVRGIYQEKISSYDVVTETALTDEVPKISNSVDADIEILKGIISILGLVLTSDQYLSVARYYDRGAAEAEQDARNRKELKAKMEIIMDAVTKTLKELDQL